MKNPQIERHQRKELIDTILGAAFLILCLAFAAWCCSDDEPVPTEQITGTVLVWVDNGNDHENGAR